MPDEQPDTLELSTFISKTLVQIVEGVEQAQEAIDELETNAVV